MFGVHMGIRSWFCDHETVERRSGCFECVNCGSLVDLDNAERVIVDLENGRFEVSVNDRYIGYGTAMTGTTLR